MNEKDTSKPEVIVALLVVVPLAIALLAAWFLCGFSKPKPEPISAFVNFTNASFTGSVRKDALTNELVKGIVQGTNETWTNTVRSGVWIKHPKRLKELLTNTVNESETVERSHQSRTIGSAMFIATKMIEGGMRLDEVQSLAFDCWWVGDLSGVSHWLESNRVEIPMYAPHKGDAK